MSTIVIILCALGALACFARCAWLLCQPAEHETDGCFQKPRGFHRQP